MAAVLQSEDIWLVMCPPTPPCGLSLTCSYCLSRKGSQTEKEEKQERKRRKWADPDHTRITLTVISAHSVIYKAQEGEYYVVIHLG